MFGKEVPIGRTLYFSRSDADTSAITLDTHSRQKEVAIRKINGAGPRVIALLFGRLYIRLLVVAAIPSLAIVYLHWTNLIYMYNKDRSWYHY